MSDPLHEMVARASGDDELEWAVQGFLYVTARSKDEAEDRASDLGLVGILGSTLIP